MAPPQGGAFDFEWNPLDAFPPSWDRLDRFAPRPGHPSNTASTPAPISSPVTAVTGLDAFAVDLTFVQTYSQAQGDV
jgi:hypothetical protein